MELRLDQVFDCLHHLQAASSAPLCAYVYDLEGLRRHAVRISSTLPPNCDLFYAVKANADLPILQTLAPLVRGFEVSSGGELAWVREHFPKAPVIFSGPGKTDAELADAIAHRVECVHVESMHELQRLAIVAERGGVTQHILLRMNPVLENAPVTSLVMGGKPSPFGIPSAHLPACLAFLKEHPALRLRGFHFHLMSHQLDAAAHLSLLSAYLVLVNAWCVEYGQQIDQINVGGGIGINYRNVEAQFDWDRFAAGLRELIDVECAPDIALRFEMGRYLTAACGYYAMQVIDIKQSYGKTYVVGRGGTHHFRTPAAQGHSHPFHVLPVDEWPYPFARPTAQNNEKVQVVGQLCTPKDVIAFEAPAECIRCNDLLVFPYAGAYAWHISHHNFLRHPHPAQCYLAAEPDSVP